MKAVFNLKELPMGAQFYLDTRGASMKNFIQRGDVLLTKRIDPNDISIGDIVVFQPKEYQDSITHRLLFKKKKKGKITFICKGDALMTFDEPVFAEDILGKILAIERGNKRIELEGMKGKMLSLFFFLLSALVFLNKRFILRCKKIKLRRGIQTFVLITKKNIILGHFYRAYYMMAIKFFKFTFSSYKEVKSIYLRRQTAKGDWDAGLSDIDLSVIIEELPYREETHFLKSFWKDYSLLKKIFPFLGEVEVVRIEELENWQLARSLRVQEVGDWKVIYGEDTRHAFQIELCRDELILNYLSEAIQSFWVLSLNVTAKGENPVYPYEYRRFFNYVSDIFRFIEKIRGNAAPDNRRDFIFDFLARQENSSLRQDLRQLADKIEYNAPKIENDVLLNIYSQLVKYLDINCRDISQNLSFDNNQKPAAHFSVRPLSEKIDINEDEHYEIWKDGISAIINVYKEAILTVLSNSHVFTDHGFIVLKDGLDIKQIKEICRKVFTAHLNKDIIVVTKNILNCVSSSLFLELPLNFWHITEQARVDFGSAPGEYLARPPDEILFALLRASAGSFNLAYRMFAKNRTPSYLLYHSIDGIMRMRLALDKGIIVSSLKDAINEYKAHYKDESPNSITRLEKYMGLTEEGINRFSGQRFFYENFEFIKNEMARLNELIERQLSERPEVSEKYVHIT